MNLWLIPQISEHWPKNNPGRIENKFNWLIRPGIASTLIPKDWIVQEWITSNEVTINRIEILNGIIKLLSVSNNRNWFKFE